MVVEAIFMRVVVEVLPNVWWEIQVAVGKRICFCDERVDSELGRLGIGSGKWVVIT